MSEFKIELNKFYKRMVWEYGSENLKAVVCPCCLYCKHFKKRGKECGTCKASGEDISGFYICEDYERKRKYVI